MKSCRGIVGEYLSQVLKNHIKPSAVTEDFQQKCNWLVKVTSSLTLKNEENANAIPLEIKHSNLKSCNFTPTDKAEFQQWTSSVTQDLASQIKSGRCSELSNSILIELNAAEFTKHILKDIVESKSLSALCADLMVYDGDLMKTRKPVQNVAIDYSSPNIAKQFHPGHLRSTVLGNVIGNLYEYLGHTVTRINYLGDWGTQFGYIGVGLDKYYSEEEFMKSPIQHYYNLYIKVNRDAQEEHCKDIQQTETNKQAIEYFRKMEEGSAKELHMWKKCREASIEEYEKTYKKLGVHFDVYDGESLHHKRAIELVHQLRERNVLKEDSDTGVKYVELEALGKTHRINLVKSNGSTLYITRDLAAALQRVEQYDCDKLLYVVENGQTQHFQHLKLLLSHIHPELFANTITQPGSQEKEIVHVKFGRVAGIKSRYGASVLLDDIITCVQDKMKEKIKNTKTTKIPLDDHDLVDRVSQQLAVSAIVVQDLNEHSGKHYQFSWDRILSPKGDTGLKLQYAHARLCSLIRKCNPRIEAMISKCDSFGDSDTGFEVNSTHPISSVQSLKMEIADSVNNNMLQSEVDEADVQPEHFERECRKQMLYLFERFDCGVLKENSALQLIHTLARFDEVIHQSYTTLQPYYLVNYLYQLSGHTNKAMYELKVLGETSERIVARLLLYHCSRYTLSEGMKILGLTPLMKM